MSLINHTNLVGLRDKLLHNNGLDSWGYEKGFVWAPLENRLALNPS